MRIREAVLDDIPGIARVHVDTWRTTYPGIIPAAYLAQLSYERSEARWHDHLAAMDSRRFVYVAEEAGRIIGQTSGGPEQDGLSGYDGELYGLYVLAEYQRHGVGRALLQTVAQRLVARRIQSDGDLGAEGQPQGADLLRGVRRRAGSGEDDHDRRGRIDRCGLRLGRSWGTGRREAGEPWLTHIGANL